MTFKGDTIVGKPTLAMVEIYIAEKGLFCNPQDCMSYWGNKQWLTHKGVEPKTLESAIVSYNSIAVQKFVQRNQKLLGISKVKRKDKKKAKRKARKELLAGNKNLDNLIKLENFGLKEPKEKSDKDYIPYEEQLKDKRWEAFRKFIFAVRGKRCEMCGEKDRLQVHHPKYRKGALAWEYNCNEVQVLCRDCHKAVHGIKD
jgi:5-methylcytosine-specific restriction endonuclease McrA